MLDIAVLRIAKYRGEYPRLRRAMPPDAMDTKTRVIMDAFGKYFEKFPTHEVVDFTVLVPRFQQWNPGMDAETAGSYHTLFRLLHQDVSEDTRKGIVQDLCQLDAMTKVANLLAQYQEGVLPEEPLGAINNIIETYKKTIDHADVPWITTDIEDLLQEDLDNSGIKWRLGCLREHMRPLRPGDFGIIAGRPDRGKTTMFSSEVTHLTPQLPPEQNTVWFNNEGPGGRVVKRLYQSALGLTIPEMVELGGKSVRELYQEAIGRVDRIRVVDIHYHNADQIERMIEASNAGLVIYDMIDKIKGFHTGASRTDERLEQMYDWGRNAAVKYGFVGIASSQISADGEGLAFPSMDMLKDSKTGKQGACDFLIMIGSKNEKGTESMRWMGIPKNKLHAPGMPKDPKQEVVFDAERGRYKDLEIFYTEETPDEVTLEESHDNS